MLITLGLVNVVLLMNFYSLDLSKYISGVGLWFSLLAFILISINRFIDLSKIIKLDSKITENEKEEKIMKDTLFNNPKKLITISFVTTIISIICNIFVILFSGANIEMLIIYFLMLLIVNGFVGNFLYFYYLKYRMGKFNIKSLNIMLFIQTCITFIYQFFILAIITFNNILFNYIF